MRFLGTAEGGRAHPVRSGYLSQHNFGRPEDVEMHIGQVVFQKKTLVSPGETVSATVHFLSHPDLIQRLHVGTEWRIQEAKQLMALATVEELLAQE